MWSISASAILRMLLRYSVITASGTAKPAASMPRISRQGDAPLLPSCASHRKQPSAGDLHQVSFRVHLRDLCAAQSRCRSKLQDQSGSRTRLMQRVQVHEIWRGPGNRSLLMHHGELLRDVVETTAARCPAPKLAKAGVAPATRLGCPRLLRTPPEQPLFSHISRVRSDVPSEMLKMLASRVDRGRRSAFGSELGKIRPNELDRLCWNRLHFRGSGAHATQFSTQHETPVHESSASSRGVHRMQ